MQFDLVGFLYVSGIVQGLILLPVLLFARSGHRQANLLMAALVTSITLDVLRGWGVTIGFWSEYPTFAATLYPLRFAWGPLLYLYAVSLTTGTLHRQQLGHFVPAIAVFLFVNLRYWNLDVTEQIALIEQLRTTSNAGDESALITRSLLFTISFGSYCLMTLNQVKRHNQRLEQHFSSLDKMNLNWLRTLSLICLVYLGCYLVFHRIPAITSDQFDINSITARLPLTVLTILMYCIAIRGLFQPSLIGGVTQAEVSEIRLPKKISPESTAVAENTSVVEAKSKQKYQRAKLDIEEAQRHKIKLMEVMESQELYLDSELTLPDLAKACDLSVPLVSQVLNSQMNQNFFSFINSYRIQLAQRMLIDEETSNMPIVELAIEVGFKSKSSFYDAFKRATNMTPTQYKKRASLAN